MRHICLFNYGKHIPLAKFFCGSHLSQYIIEIYKIIWFLTMYVKQEDSEYFLIKGRSSKLFVEKLGSVVYSLNLLDRYFFKCKKIPEILINTFC